MYSKHFKDWYECKMIVLELEHERSGKIESVEIWENILDAMAILEKDMVDEKEAIDSIMYYIACNLLLPMNVFPSKWLGDKISTIRSMINYYKNNEEE